MPFQLGNPGRAASDPRERFRRYVAPSESGCWEWVGAKTWDGYGRFRLPDRTMRAHRYAWQLTYGDVSEGMQLDHLCRNRGCVNPAHLEEVSLAVNLNRGIRRGNRKTTPYIRPRAAQ